MKPSRRLEVVLYTRPDCCLCHEAKQVLETVRRRRPFELLEKNVDETPELASLYGQEIPVVLVEGRKAFKYRVDPIKLERLLDRAEESAQRS
ncbi:MAG: glutaredoxin family protein [Candidatus Wallbacteria bacterium]|nr:glutaredoxin family protein [Candidatus Wallbacteria bacterium]